MNTEPELKQNKLGDTIGIVVIAFILAILIYAILFNN